MIYFNCSLVSWTLTLFLKEKQKERKKERKKELKSFDECGSIFPNQETVSEIFSWLKLFIFKEKWQSDCWTLFIIYGVQINLYFERALNVWSFYVVLISSKFDLRFTLDNDTLELERLFYIFVLFRIIGVYSWWKKLSWVVLH